MSIAEVDERINLNEIVDISEDEFKKQISAWINERGISRKLQSKLRADLFEQFNRTKLGRQMTEQHQLAHRMVLSPLILVLNTLVAEFLYTEDCHFTLSVFANEVPYKNTLPNFEATPVGQLFQFSPLELNDIFEAIGFSKKNEQIVREFYINRTRSQDVLNKSLLHCIMKAVISQIDSGRTEKINGKIKSKTKTSKIKQSKSNANIPSTSSQHSLDSNLTSDRKNTSSESFRHKYEHLHISSRYFKYLNRYLDILSERINDMSKSLAEKRSTSKKSQPQAVDSSSQEESLKNYLRKITENINKLAKSQRKSKQFHGVLNSIERLSTSVEKCSGKLEDLLKIVNTETIEKKQIENKVDHFGSMDYTTWLRELKTSENGRKFIERLEVSLQKTMEKERENLDKLYEEKTNNYRMLIRLHYKQKYDANKSEPESVERREKEVFSPIDKFTPDDTEKILAESMAARALEREQEVDQIVQTAKIRLQQLERESEVLDQSFQAYLRRQQISKQQMNEDASKIWENYSLSKAALADYGKTEDKHTIPHSNVIDTMKMDTVLNSTFHNDVDIEEVLKDLNEIKQLKGPTFNKKETFSKESIWPPKFSSYKVNTNSGNRPVIDYNQKLFDTQIKVKLPENRNIIIPQKTYDISPRNDETKEKQTERKIGLQRENTFTITPDSAPILDSIGISTSLVTKTQSESIMSNGHSVPKKTSTPTLAVKKTESRENGVHEDAVNIPERVVSPLNLIDKMNLQKNGNFSTSDNKKEMENTNSSLKVNGFSKTNHSKINGTVQFSEVTVGNDVKPSTGSTSNGFANKMTTFKTVASESDSIEADSDLISIGAQRAIKSPDDFWI